MARSADTMPPTWRTPSVVFRPAKKIIGFWHIGAVGDWYRIVHEQYSKLMASGLYDASEKIVVGFVGGKDRERELDIPVFEDPKFEVFATDHVEDYEFPTLARLWREAHTSREPFLCYYFHTKGASLVDTSQQRAANAWRVYMEYFNIEKWQECAAILHGYETCGVELQSDDSHYSGNFWWATSDYVRRLPDGYRYWEQNKDNRVAAEFYLCQARPKAYCFNDFAEDLYDHVIAPERYRR